MTFTEFFAGVKSVKEGFASLGKDYLVASYEFLDQTVLQDILSRSFRLHMLLVLVD